MAKTDIVKHQFRPGQSGNPAGKKAGTINTKTILRKWLSVRETVINPITGKQAILTQLDLMTLALLAKAKKGDVMAFNALLDRLEGKPRQYAEVLNETDAPIIVNLIPAPGCEALHD